MQTSELMSQADKTGSAKALGEVAGKEWGRGKGERKAGSDHTEPLKTFERNLDFTPGAMGSFWKVLSRGMTQYDLHIERLL